MGRTLLLLSIIACLTAPHPAAAGELHVIVGGDSPVKRISRRQLARIYLKKTLINDQGIPWTPLNLEAAHPLRQAFSQALFKQFPEEMEAYWNVQYFQGVSPPYVVGSEKAVVSFIAATPGAIGYIAPCRLDSGVKVVYTLKVNAPTQDTCRTTPEN